MRQLRVGLVLAVLALALPASPGRAATTEPAATPKAVCGPGSKPETGLQGRVPPADRLDGRAAKGYSCNATLVGSFGKAGGFKVLRYVDKAKHECAYFDVSMSGVRVLDMSHPSKPVLTATLTTPAMFSPHESLALNQKRGLLVAVLGNALTAPGIVDVYDVTKDCRHPVLDSSSAVGLLGHESGFSPDGRTYYATAAISGTMAAADLTDPKHPFMAWVGAGYTHGLTLSDDGKTAYTAGFPPGVLIPPGGLRNVVGRPA
ncbi:MAG: hypothetical protein JWM40_310 [Frankiales bacterium]|nr:hypothetical protein [Frankiales bacterium]